MLGIAFINARSVYLHEACHALIPLCSKQWLQDAVRIGARRSRFESASTVSSACHFWTVVRLGRKTTLITLYRMDSGQKERLLPAIRAMAKQGSSSFAPIAL